MIDFRVAIDKIAQFETADEIANFLRENGIQACQGDSTSCAIAQYVTGLTGKRTFVGIQVIYFNPPGEDNFDQLEEAEDTFDNTPTIREFVYKFDDGAYPDLVDPETYHKYYND